MRSNFGKPVVRLITLFNKTTSSSSSEYAGFVGYEHFIMNNMGACVKSVYVLKAFDKRMYDISIRIGTTRFKYHKTGSTNLGSVYRM